VISEGSCDTEDWSNDAEIYHCNKKYIQIKNIVYLTVIHNYSKVASIHWCWWSHTLHFTNNL